MKNQDRTKTTLLLVDDEPMVLSLLTSAFKNQGFRVLCASDGKEALSLFAAEPIDLAIMDYSLPDLCGADLYSQFHTQKPELPIVFLTGCPNLETAVNLMKEGVRDYLTKPFSLEEISERIRAILKPRPESNSEASRGRLPRAARTAGQYLFGSSRPMRAAEVQIRNLPRYPDTTVLITGPTGTGKTAVARQIHELTCGKDAPFVEIDCSTIPRELCESELFGHEKGAFTGAHSAKQGLFEAAGRGTAFLDEIGELDPSLQVKFLRVLESRQFKRVGAQELLPMPARVIAATNRSLPDLVRAGRFREDLYFRLNVFELWIPPLRERGDDISMLARHFLDHYATRYGKNIQRFAPEAVEFLRNYDFPGNVRELRNMVERAVINAGTSEVRTADLVTARQGNCPSSSPSLQVLPALAPEGADEPNSPVSTIADLEREALREALEVAHGNKTLAAQMVGLSRTAFHRRFQKYFPLPKAAIAEAASCAC
jgi:DNA-binding NtrC family response regulator